MDITYIITYTTDAAETTHTVEVSAASFTKAVIAAAKVLPGEICKGDEIGYAILNVEVKNNARTH